MDTIGTSVIQEQQEVDGLISQARIQYGKVCVSQHELGVTLLKLRDATKAQGNRTGKGFEACLAEIGISKTQAYRFMRAAETGEPVDYDNSAAGGEATTTPTPEELGDATSSRNGTRLPPNATAEQIEAAVFFRHLEALGVQVGHYDSNGERKWCYVLPYGVILTSVGATFPEKKLTYQQWLEIGAILRVLAPLPADDRSEHQRKLDARRTRRMTGSE